MKKILKFDDNPPIKTYPYIAFYLGILMGNSMDIDNLLIKRFTNIFYFNSKIDFVSSGYFHRRLFSHELHRYHYLKNIKNIKKELINEKYVIIILNEKYIDSLNCKLKENYYHDWLIYGFDDNDESFYCCGYIGKDRKIREYKSIKIPYNEIQNSLNHVHLNSYSFTLKDTHTTQIKKWEEIQLDKRDITKILKNILNPPKLSFYYRPIINMNINSLKKLSLQIKKKYLNSENSALWIQSFRVIYEQLIVLSIIERKYIKNESIHNDLDNNISLAYSLLILCAKYNMQPKLKILNSITDILLELQKNVINILNKMLLQIEC